MDKPSLPKGTRDFGPAVMAKRQFILEHIRGIFKKYGFMPLETPAMENLTTLEGKYGDEGDQLIFRVLDSGEYIKSAVASGVFKLGNLTAEETEQFFLSNLRMFAALENVFYKAAKELFRRYPNKDWQREELLAVVEEPRWHNNIGTAMYVSNDERKILGEFINKNILPQKEKVADDLDKALKLVSLHPDSNLEEEIQVLSLMFFNNTIIPAFGPRFSHFLSEKIEELFQNISTKKITRHISEKGLRYDLTVPFARYVVMNRNEVTLPFKRYQIQPVWRADRPQKGRYREFYQCDADVVGTDSLICEAEILLMIKEAFLLLGIKDYTIKINHRGVLSGLAEVAGLKDNETTLFVAIDKLDKIGEDGVRKELEQRGVSGERIDLVFNVLNTKGDWVQKMNSLYNTVGSTKAGMKGFSDISGVYVFLKHYGVTDEHIEFDLALARGLSYYTGCIFEVKINNVAIGSVSGGGRYDNLVEAFGSKEKLSGVGISFGIDRIYDAMEELNVFPDETQISSKVLVCHFDEFIPNEGFDQSTMTYGLKVLHTLRQNGISSEIYPDLTKKINKQLEYADKKMIPYTIMIGSEEMQSGLLTLKNMKSGDQLKKNLEDIIKLLK